MESINISDKYMKQLLDGKAKDYLKAIGEDNFIIGNLKFSFSQTGQDMIIKISLIDLESGDSILSLAREITLRSEDTFTYGPVYMQIDLT